MNIHSTRKQSPNLSENRPKKIRTIENPILTKRKNNNDNRTNLYRFTETKNKIIQQLSELFIPKEDLSNNLSIISKFTLDNSNFLLVWNNFVESISDYLDKSINFRCSIYINEKIDDCRNQINEIYNRLNSDHKQINKKNSSIYKNIQSDLDNLYLKLNQPGNGKIKIISESSSLFDQFTNALRSNYLPFFQCVSNDQKTMNIFLKSAIKPICDIINCIDSVLNLEKIQKDFSTQLNHATATFVKIYNSQYPSSKKAAQNSQIPILSNSLKVENSTKQQNGTSKIPKIKKRSASLSSPLSQKPLVRYNSTHMQPKNNGSNIKPTLRHRKSETSIISLPDFSQKKFLPKTNKTIKNDTNARSRKNSKSDNDEDQKNSLDTHMHTDDMYVISNGKLSDSGDETTNVPIKPKPFKISQTRYDQLNKKYSNSPIKSINTNNNSLLLNNEKSNQRKSSRNQLNLSSSNSLSSQIRTKKDEENKMVKTIENLTHKNDRLKEQHRSLKHRIEKDRNLTQINNLKTEIDSLKSDLNDTQFNSDEMKINVEFMKDMIDILNSNIQSIDEDCEQALRIKNGIESEDETANFDNPNLKRSCDALKIKLNKIQSQINENNNKRDVLLNVLLNSNQSSTEYEEIDSKKSDKYYDNENESHNLSHYSKNPSNKQKKIQPKTKATTKTKPTKQTRIPTLQKNSNSASSSANTSTNNSSNLSLNEIDLSLSNEDIREAFVRLKISSQVSSCANKHLMSLFEQLKILPNPIEQKSATSFLNKSEFGGLRKLSKNIEKLEENVKKVRQSSSFSSLYNMYFSMKSSAVRMKEELVEIGIKNKRLLNEISRLSLIQSKVSSRSNQGEFDTDGNGSGNLKRKSFDLYEVLKEKSRELLIRYFAVQKTFSEDLETAEKYKIEMQMDDIQEQYTTVMMEIDRIGDTKIQEKLHTKRKIKIRGRKEIPKLFEILEEASKFNLESEKKAVSLEKKVGATFSALLKSIDKKSDHLSSQNNNDDDTDYLYRHRMDNDEESVTRLAEVIIECRKVSEILTVIKDRSKQFLNSIHKDDQIQLKDDELLKKLISDVKELMKKGGSKAQTKLQIVNLKREIQYYSNMD